ncbi:hypothetical protein ACIG0C_30215 [Kitasatospora aureofaciens]|uniref:Uncharacterized protein n=2 Tax=Kitasatospora aureofaciens TaxID=1894 RepID=A0A1E7NEA5_KITAU|nr:hypothetical protein [Kitasatospora aureofaciens]ARF83230.1 hypothetical protein B6264_30285 [Kitasatospora aureofaciens]OEV39002.1 hypothetical protein HS99_0018015 [Kitasatospora aureofaciens]GGU99432.1 hypothetical protein GCM10010502_62370 [Kitasatospora aureofaciens]
MADDTTGGTVHTLPGLSLPGVVGEDGPGDGLPTLAPLTTEFAPPASLSVEEGPDLSGREESTANGMEAAPAAGSGSFAGTAAMSTVMMAGITVAALRGAYHAVGYLKARAEHFKAVRDQQSAAAGKANTELEKARVSALAAQQRGRFQSGPEFGRNTRNGGPNSPQSSGRTNGPVPSTFRSTAPTGPTGPQPKKPETGRGGGQDGGPGSGGNTGPGRVQEARRGALEASGRNSRLERNSGPQNGPRNGPLNSRQDRPGRQLAGSDTIRGATRQRAADRILNGPKDRPPGPDRSKPDRQTKADRQTRPERPAAGPDTVRGAARRRVADRITTGSWKPTGAHNGGGATPDTIRGALRKRAVDRILNGKKPKEAKDGTTAAAQPATPSTELAVRPGTPGTGSGPAGAAGTASAAGTRKGRRFRRLFTPGGAPGSRPWRLRRPGTTAPGSPEDLRARKRQASQERKARKSQERQERRARQTRERAERTNTRRSQKARRTGRATGTATGQAAGTGTDGFGPPPGWFHSPEHKVRRYDRPDPDKAAPAIGRGQAALPRAPYSNPHTRPGTTRPNPMPPASPTGGRPVTIPAPRAAAGAQYAGDSDLTIYDVIEADADMAEEILAGADDAREAAEGCEKLLGRLEALHAKVLALKVPGVLEGLVASLIEKAEEVKAKADAVAEKIPAAAEAIAVAGTNAARRDQQVADTTRDMGHAAPAERDYHQK